MMTTMTMTNDGDDGADDDDDDDDGSGRGRGWHLMSLFLTSNFPAQWWFWEAFSCGNITNQPPGLSTATMWTSQCPWFIAIEWMYTH